MFFVIIYIVIVIVDVDLLAPLAAVAEILSVIKHKTFRVAHPDMLETKNCPENIKTRYRKYC